MEHSKRSRKGKEIMPIVPRRSRILLAACGTAAAAALTYFCHYFSQWAEVHAVATMKAMHFIDPSSLPVGVTLYTDESERNYWKKLGDTALYQDLQSWADIMVIAPLSANTLAKITSGLCDNLLTCIVRSWDHGKPLVVAPDMDPSTWENSLTESQISAVDDLGISLIRPVRRIINQVDLGTGAMEDPSEITTTVKSILNHSIKLSHGGSVK